MYNSIKTKNPAHAFFCQLCDIFKNAFTEHLRVITSVSKPLKITISATMMLKAYRTMKLIQPVVCYFLVTFTNSIFYPFQKGGYDDDDDDDDDDDGELLAPSGTSVTDPHLRETPTSAEQDLNLGRT